MNDIALLPCPFCGGEPSPWSCDRLAFVECKACQFRLHGPGIIQTAESPAPVNDTEFYHADAVDKLHARWNTRTPLWQPIDSAPKDGTTILLRSDGGVPVVGNWRGGGWWADTENHRVRCGPFCYGGRVATEHGFRPTQWCRLP